MQLTSSLYPYLRICLGDTNAVPLISSGQLDMLIQFAVLEENSYREKNSVPAPVYYAVYDTGGGVMGITPDWQNQRDMLLILYQAAIASLLPIRANSGFGAGRMKVNRTDRGMDIVAEMKMKVRQNRVGEWNTLMSSEWDTYLQGTARMIAKIMSYPG